MTKVLFILIAMVSSVGWGQTKDANMYPTQQEGLLIPPGISEIENGGYGVGNGGDFVRARFIKVGFEIIDYLTNHEEGVAFTSTYSINVFALNSVLNTHVVLPTDEKPTDNRGQKVDAIFKNGNLYLYVPTWERFLSSRDEMYLMVFHEMLRVTGHFDDHYVISRNLEIPSNLELSDKPPKSSNHFVCLCSQNENGNGYVYVKLLCVESQTQEIVIEITYDAVTFFSTGLIENGNWRHPRNREKIS